MKSRSLMMPAAMLFAICRCGCAASEVHSFVDPDFQDTVYHRLAIVPTSADLKERHTTELRFAEALEATQAQAVPSMTILLPTREYS